MRISTSSLFNQQTYSIDNLAAEEQVYANELSSGKSLNLPSDNPTLIGQDLSVRSDITVQTAVGQNLSNVSQQLSTVDSALSNLTSVMQSARSIAVEAAQDTLTTAQRQAMAASVGQLLSEAIGFANTQFGGEYVFNGTAATSGPPVQGVGQPITAVNFNGNEVAQNQTLPNGESIQTSTTLQQAFNVNASDGSPSVFQTLINLQNELQNGNVVDQSATQVNVPGQAIIPGNPPPVGNATTLGQMMAAPPNAILQTPLTTDNSTIVPPPVPPVQLLSISIASGSAPNGVTLTFNTGESMTQVVAAINAQTGQTGVTATFNAQTQKLSLAGNGAFTVTNVPTPVGGGGATTAATNTGNFVQAFNLQSSASVVSTISDQLGDIDNANSVLSTARSVIGASVQTVSALTSDSSVEVTTDTSVQSAIEDTDIGKVTTEFTQTQTALQAAYGTTTRLEQSDLFDFLQ